MNGLHSPTHFGMYKILFGALMGILTALFSSGIVTRDDLRSAEWFLLGNIGLNLSPSDNLLANPTILIIYIAFVPWVLCTLLHHRKDTPSTTPSGVL